MPTIPQTQSVLLSYFQTGDEPSQDQFAEFIGTMFYLYQATLNQATAAAASAAAAVAAAQASGPLAYCRCILNTLQDFTITKNSNIASVAGVNVVGVPITFTFTTPLPDTKYVPLVYLNGVLSTLAITKNLDSIVLTGGDTTLVVGMEITVFII